jgi:two-component system, LuxR family, sensor kinase FixL
MNWITVAWPMIAGTCFTLAALHLMIGFKRHDKAHLLYATFAAGVACFTLFELQMTQAATVGEFGFLQRWIHLPAYVLIVASIWSIHFFFGTGGARFAWALTGFYALLLAINFSTGASINYQRIDALRPIDVWGGVQVPIVDAVVNPWSRLEALAFVLWILFIAQATVQLWRRGDPESRRKAALVGGSFLFLGLVGASVAQLRHEGIIDFPYLRAWVVFAGLLALGYELSSDVFRATELARQVHVTEADAREQAERLRLALTGARLALWDWDLRAGTVYLSDRWQEMVGGFPQPIVITFRALATLVHPDDFPELRRRLREVLKGRSPEYEVEHRVRTMSGNWIWIHSRGEVVARDPNGRAVRMSGVNEDISERKQAEERFRQNEAEMAQQRSELAHLSRAAMLGEISGSLAHELNQPLAAILSNAQAAQRFLAQDPGDLREVRAILQDIVDDDKRAGEVIRRLRALLRKEGIEHHPVDVNEVVLDVLRIMRSDLVNRNVTVSTQLAPALPQVTGDRVQLQQVMLNLVINGCDAVEASRTQDRQLTVRTALVDGHIEVAVADRGKGIGPADLERVFQPFVTTKADGMGLGLAVCRTIVTAHAGRIWAARNADAGMTFHFTVPVSRAQIAASA